MIKVISLETDVNNSIYSSNRCEITDICSKLKLIGVEMLIDYLSFFHARAHSLACTTQTDAHTHTHTHIRNQQQQRFFPNISNFKQKQLAVQ